jgi:hypothetical protein
MGNAMEQTMNPGILIGAAFALYALVHIGLNLAMRRARIEMVELAEQILADPAVSDAGKYEVNHVLDTCMSFKVGAIVPIAVIGVFIDEVRGAPEPADEFAGDTRFTRLLLLYYASVLAANPLLAIVSIPIALVGTFITATIGSLGDTAKSTMHERVVTAFEAPLLKASEQVWKEAA